MPGGLQPDADIAQVTGSPQARACCGPRPIVTEPGAHQRQRVGGGQDGRVTGAGVVGVRVGDDGTVYRPQRVDEEATGLAEQAFGQDLSQVSGCGGIEARRQTPIA